MKLTSTIIVIFFLFVVCHCEFPFQNTSLSWDERVNDLVSHLTLEEMVEQMAYGGGVSRQPTPAIPRLQIKPYQFDTECLRGVMNEKSTAFPQAVGLSATFSPDLIHDVAQIIGTEARAINNNATSHGDFSIMTGISCLAPFINIVRHPLWGRIQEVYGEDPYLSGELAASYVQGLQGDDPRFIRANGGCKVVDVHSGPENIPVSRMSFNAEVSERDFRLTFLPNFKRCIEAGSYNLMCSYNAINGVPSCGNKRLLTEILRNEYGFKGYYISDEGAIPNMWSEHHFVATELEAAALAANAGVNLELPSKKIPTYTLLNEAVMKDMVPYSTIVDLVKPLFYTRMKLGEFDPPDQNPYASIDTSVILSKEHIEAAIYTATKTFVLLKNKNSTLPLKKTYDKIALVGPMADNIDQQYGNYAPLILKEYATSPKMSLQSLTKSLQYAAGCADNHCIKYNDSEVQEAIKGAEVVIICLGTGTDVEQEGNDRSSIDLPGYQLQLLQQSVKYAQGVPVILILFSGGPLDVGWAKNNDGVSAILQCWFPAQSTGEALRRVLALSDKGVVTSPAARLPYTWPASLQQVPAMVNYSMEGRTYRYLKDPPLYPFGYGLSYSTYFEYSNLNISPLMVQAGSPLTVSVDVANLGNYDSDEVVQVYLKWLDTTILMPQLQLVGVERTFLKAGTSQKFNFTVKGEQMQVWDNQFFYEKGQMSIYVGGQQPFQDTKTQSNILQGTFQLG